MGRKMDKEEDVVDIAEESPDMLREKSSEEEMNQQDLGVEVPFKEEEKKEFQALEERLAELEDSLKRQVADFDNYRKRVQEEKERLKNSTQEDVILSFLPVFDNLERAFQSCRAPGATLEGVMMGLEGIMALFMDFLAHWHIQRVDSVGQAFDPKVHEALFMEQGDYKQKEVIQEVEKAYIRRDKVIRTAKVGVGVPSTQSKEE